MKHPTGLHRSLRLCSLQQARSAPPLVPQCSPFRPSTIPARSLSTAPASGRASSPPPTAPSARPYASPSSGFSTINASEISHFSRLSSEWWNPHGEFKILHRMNPARVAYVRDKVALAPDPETEAGEEEWTFEWRHEYREREAQRGRGRWLAGKRVLDVGCGGGLLSESLARLGGDVLAIDAAEQNIAIAQLHASQDPFLPYVPPPAPPAAPEQDSSPSRSTWSGLGRTSRPPPVPASVSDTGSAAKSAGTGRLEYRHTTAESLRDQKERFDVVCSMEVLEHVDEPNEFLKCLGEMVKPGGHLILSTISRTPLSQLLTITMAEDVLRLVTPGTHTYRKFVRPAELRRFVCAEMGGEATWVRHEDASDVRQDEIGETRGIMYLPWKGEWILGSRIEGTWAKEAGEQCNYMFHARKRRDAPA